MERPAEILIAIHGLEPGMKLSRDLRAGDGERVLARKGALLNPALLARIKEKGINAAYVYDNRSKGTAVELSKELLRKRISEKDHRHISVDPALRVEAVHQIESLFAVASDLGAHSIHDGVQVIRHLDKVVGELVDTLQEDPAALVNIQDLKSYDEYTYHHSLSVAVLSLAIGQYLEWDKQSLHRLGMCAILHDIGKTAVPVELINKPGRLTDAEFETVKGHSTSGYDYLCRMGYTDREILEGVLHHHERLDGNGYPQGLRGEEIPVMSRIISVADVYDALTSHRSYRNPMEPGEAVEYVMGNVGKAFDYETTVAFISKVELYPVGGIVKLSNGKQARVLDNEHHNRPLVQIIDTNQRMDMYKDFGTYNIVVEKLIAK